MSTTYHPIGSILDPVEPTTRVEVCVCESYRPNETPVIFITKYQGGEVGDRSIGLHPDIVCGVAAMLEAAGARCRADAAPTVSSKQRSHIPQETIGAFDD